MKTKEELNALKEEVETVNIKFLNDSELEKVSGGPEERTVLGLSAASDCKKCENCGMIPENDSIEFCPACGGKIS